MKKMTTELDEIDTIYVYSKQEIAMAIVPKFGAALSLLGSMCIIAEVWQDHMRVRGARAVSRILLSMSISDIFFSVGWFLTTWPIPYGLPFAWGAAGNTSTCAFQGFIIQIGWMATPLFNIAMAVFYLLMIKYSWTDEKLKPLEPWVHGCIWGVAWGTAIMCIPLQLLNSNLYVCWIDSYPYGCEGDDCIRGKNAWIYAMAFVAFPEMFSIAASFVLFGIIVHSVYRAEQRSQRHMFKCDSSKKDLIKRDTSQLTFGNSSSDLHPIAPLPYAPQPHEKESHKSYRRSRIAAHQAICYVGAFWITFVPDMISSLVYYISNGTKWFFWLDIFAYFLLPTQGFFNFCVFVRRRKEMKTRYGNFLREIVCCFCQNRQRNLFRSESGWMLSNLRRHGSRESKKSTDHPRVPASCCSETKKDNQTTEHEKSYRGFVSNQEDSYVVEDGVSKPNIESLRIEELDEYLDDVNSESD